MEHDCISRLHVLSKQCVRFAVEKRALPLPAGICHRFAARGKLLALVKRKREWNNHSRTTLRALRKPPHHFNKEWIRVCSRRIDGERLIAFQLFGVIPTSDLSVGWIADY